MLQPALCRVARGARLIVALTMLAAGGLAAWAGTARAQDTTITGAGTGAGTGVESAGEVSWGTLADRRVRLRMGPRHEAPTKLTYQRAGVPVILVERWENWVRIADMDGDEGWVERNKVSSLRSFVVTGSDEVALRAAPQADAMVVARLQRGLMGRLSVCQAGWCSVIAKAPYRDFEGWVAEADIWGGDADLTRLAERLAGG